MNNIPLEVPEIPEPKVSLKAKLDGKINYKSGKEDGLKEEYYENGQLETKGYWKD